MLGILSEVNSIIVGRRNSRYCTIVFFGLTHLIFCMICKKKLVHSDYMDCISTKMFGSLIQKKALHSIIFMNREIRYIKNVMIRREGNSPFLR